MYDVAEISDTVTRKYCNIPLYYFSKLTAFDIDCPDFTCSGEQHNIDGLFDEIEKRLKNRCLVRYYKHGIHIYLDEDEKEVILYLHKNMYKHDFWIEPMYNVSLCGGPEKRVKMLGTNETVEDGGLTFVKFLLSKLLDSQQLVLVHKKTLFLSQLIKCGRGGTMESLVAAYNQTNTPVNSCSSQETPTGGWTSQSL